MLKLKKTKQEQPKQEEQEQAKLEKEIDHNFYQRIIRILGGMTILLIGVLVMIVMRKLPSTSFNQVLMGLGLGGVFLAFAMYKLINKTVGFKFVALLFKAKRMKNKGYGILKEFCLSGRPKYHLTKYDDIIRYDTVVNGEKKRGFVLYNPYAKYDDFGANVPVIEATYNDISLKNVFTGNRIGMNPDLADKIIVESGVSRQELDDVKKHRRWLLYLLAGIAIAGIISFDLFAQRLAEVNQQALACYQQIGKSATIVAGGFVRNIFKKEDTEE